MIINNYNYSIDSGQNVVYHTNIMTICNLIYTQVKQTPNRDLRQRKILAWQVDFWGERNVLRFDLKESREGLCWRAFFQPPFFIGHIGEARERERVVPPFLWTYFFN